MSDANMFPEYLPEKQLEDLRSIANNLLTNGKGILAADETPRTLGIRFKSIGLENTSENRAAYREMLFSTDPCLSKYISGIILHPETLSDTTEDGTPLISLILDRKIIPGIKVDTGFVELAGTFDECTTQGLDDLDARCKLYKKYGCEFAKWRCALKICSTTPSYLALKETSNAIARYAVICQQNGLVPIIEPEVLCDGNHNLEVSKHINELVLSYVYKALADHHVYLEGTILKTNFVRSGHTSCRISTVSENAAATIEVLRRTVPASVPGIAFLSGGLTELAATSNLNEVNIISGKKPWTLTFSYGRAIQNSVLKAWKGKKENTMNGQCTLLKLTKANSTAAMGFYEEPKKTPAGQIPVVVANYAY